MNKSDNIAELACALAKAQAEMKNPAFDAKNPHFKSNYASLASVRNTVIPVLAKHGISVIQDVYSTDNGVCCTQLIMHTSGQWIQSTGITVPTDKQNAHGYGSATTYARRFSLMALVCVVGDEDDDGNVAVEAKSAAPKLSAVEINAYKQRIKEAQTLEHLKKLWASVPVSAKAQLELVKDARKTDLEEQDA